MREFCATLLNALGRMNIGRATNQGVVGSNPAGRAKNQGLGGENQVLLPAVGPLWNELSTGPLHAVKFEGLGMRNQVLLHPLWNSVGLRIHTPTLAFNDPKQCPCASTVDNQVRLCQEATHIGTRIMTGH